MYARNQHNIAKQLSFKFNFKLRLKRESLFELGCWKQLIPECRKYLRPFFPSKVHSPLKEAEQRHHNQRLLCGKTVVTKVQNVMTPQNTSPRPSNRGKVSPRSKGATHLVNLWGVRMSNRNERCWGFKVNEDTEDNTKPFQKDKHFSAENSETHCAPRLQSPIVLQPHSCQQQALLSLSLCWTFILIYGTTIVMKAQAGKSDWCSAASTWLVISGYVTSVDFKSLFVEQGIHKAPTWISRVWRMK